MRIGGTSTCWIPFFAWICALILAAAAAAAAAASVTLAFFCSALEGLSEAPRPIGLRVRRESGSLLEGDRERRSKRERGGRSDSSLSKRERGRRSSDMLRALPVQRLWALKSEVVVDRRLLPGCRTRSGRLGAKTLLSRKSAGQSEIHIQVNHPPREHSSSRLRQF